MIVTTTCIYCGVGCHLDLHVRNGEVVEVTPGRKGPGEGKLCIKGWSAHEFIHHQDRLNMPLIKENGTFRESTWEEALELVASKLNELKLKDGADSIGFFSSAKATNEDNYMMQKLARAVKTTLGPRGRNASTVTGLVAAFGSGAMTNSMEDVEESDVIFIIGSNTSEQHPLIARRMINAVKNGAMMIIADPREIALCEYADIYMQHHPGSDVALLNAMMQVILTECLHDQDFIDERTEGFKEFKEAVMQYSPEKVEEITGVPAEKIREAAHLFGSADKASIFFSMVGCLKTSGRSAFSAWE